MNIAVSGSHRTGKSTLIGELASLLPDWSCLEEPYCQLEEEGYAFSADPSLEDFEMQLERSIESIAEIQGSWLLDRCPADFLAYLLTHEQSDRFELNRWLERFHKAMRRLDLVVFVPVESPDRIDLEGIEEDDTRRAVDALLREILVGDRWSLGLEVIEVTGSSKERVDRVLAAMR